MVRAEVVRISVVRAFWCIALKRCVQRATNAKNCNNDNASAM